MTKWEEMKQWSIDMFINWLILIEVKAIANADEINKMSIEDLQKDWLEFLMKEE